MKKEKLIQLLKNSKSNNVFCYVNGLYMPIDKVVEELGSIVIVVKDINPSENANEFKKVIE